MVTLKIKFLRNDLFKNKWFRACKLEFCRFWLVDLVRWGLTWVFRICLENKIWSDFLKNICWRVFFLYLGNFICFFLNYLFLLNFDYFDWFRLVFEFLDLNADVFIYPVKLNFRKLYIKNCIYNISIKRLIFFKIELSQINFN